MQEVYDLEGEYKDKLIKSKSSIFIHKLYAFWKKIGLKY